MRKIACKGKSASRQCLSSFKLLPVAIRKIVTSDDVVLHMALHPYIFEVMWLLVELAVEVLAEPVEFLSLDKLLEALCVGLDLNSPFYKLRCENNRREIMVSLWRQESVLQVPGFFLKVFGATIGQIYCVKIGVKHVGEGCKCWKPPAEADGVLINLTQLLGRGSCGFDHIFRVLSMAECYSLVTVDLLLRLLEYKAGNMNWGRTLIFTKLDFIKRVKTEFKNMYFQLCFKLCHHLDEIVRVGKFNLCPNFNTKNEEQWSFLDVRCHMHSISCWGVTYYGGSIDFECMRATVCKLQQKLWEQLFDVEWFSMACTSIGGTTEASLILSPEFGRMDLQILFVTIFKQEMELAIRRFLLLSFSTNAEI